MYWAPRFQHPFLDLVPSRPDLSCLAKENIRRDKVGEHLMVALRIGEERQWAGAIKQAGGYLSQNWPQRGIEKQDPGAIICE
jgi:hypothetical protein